MTYQRVTDQLPTKNALNETHAIPLDGQSSYPETDQISAAARWLAEHWHVAPGPVTRTLREMFGLGFDDAVKAMAEARRLVAR